MSSDTVVSLRGFQTLVMKRCMAPLPPDGIRLHQAGRRRGM